MEIALVKFSGTEGEEIGCGVNIDGQSSGRTFQKLMVQTGHHEFTLDTDIPHQPAKVERLVQNTASDDPDIIEFAVS